jgi:hypothetical protein
MPLDAAILDIDLRGEAVYPLAEALLAQGTPFCFLTGYYEWALPTAWRGTPRVEKPFEASALLDALQKIVTGGSARTSPELTAASGLLGRGSETARLIRESRNLMMESRILRER